MSNSKCEWLLQTEESHSILFQFTDFDIEASDNCTNDVVRIYDGAVQNNNTLLFRSCGNMVGSNSTGFGNRPLKSTTNSMLVVFESNGNFEAKGFSAQYSMVFVDYLNCLKLYRAYYIDCYQILVVMWIED